MTADERKGSGRGHRSGVSNLRLGHEALSLGPRAERGPALPLQGSDFLRIRVVMGDSSPFGIALGRMLLGTAVLLAILRVPAAPSF